MKTILALDQGTTSSRAILFRKDRAILASAQREFPQYFPKPGWVEHNASEIWQCQLEVALEVLEKAGITPDEIAAIGITNQRETTVVWDRVTGLPIGPAIVWQDRRTTPFCEALKEQGHAPLFKRKTGLLLDPYFSGTKLRWILDHTEGARARAERGELAFGTIDSWLVWNLSKGALHITDASNASRTLLFNIHTGAWDAELLDLLGIPASLLPDVVASSEQYGKATIEGLAGIPLAGIAGDQSAALFGQQCFSAGMAKNTYGTGCFLLMNTGTRAVASENNLLTTVAWKIGDTIEYALEGSIFMAGATIQWLRDGLGIIKSSSEMDTLAAKAPDSGGVVFVPAFTGLGAPYWDPTARGSLFGMTRGTTASHIARAALEAIAFQSYDILTAMQKDSGIPLAELRVDGGASRSDLLLQFQADLLQRNVVRPAVIESTALGAASLAAIAVGFWANAPSKTSCKGDTLFSPQQPPETMHSLHQRWLKGVERASHWETL